VAKLEKRALAETYTHPRGWGREIWIENRDEYCGKILQVAAGKRGSLHYHMKKLETMFCLVGKIQLRLIDPDTGKEYFRDLSPGDSILIPRGQVHQIISPELDSEIIEFSTKHEESDSYRVQKGD
jgi:mannose-6-phosphate isomerase-like protein (cupin superfamily)